MNQLALFDTAPGPAPTRTPARPRPRPPRVANTWNGPVIMPATAPPAREPGDGRRVGTHRDGLPKLPREPWPPTSAVSDLYLARLYLVMSRQFRTRPVPDRNWASHLFDMACSRTRMALAALADTRPEPTIPAFPRGNTES